jgi:hypothetical protein
MSGSELLCILETFFLCLSIKLFLVLLEYLVWPLVGGEESHIVHLRPSPLVESGRTLRGGGASPKQ